MVAVVVVVVAAAVVVVVIVVVVAVVVAGVVVVAVAVASVLVVMVVVVNAVVSGARVAGDVEVDVLGSAEDEDADPLRSFGDGSFVSNPVVGVSGAQHFITRVALRLTHDRRRCQD